MPASPSVASQLALMFTPDLPARPSEILDSLSASFLCGGERNAAVAVLSHHS